MKIHNTKLQSELGEKMVLGNCFAFLHRAAGRHPALRWLDDSHHHVISLLGHAPVEIPGASLDPWHLPDLDLSLVTSDKSLYAEEREDVHLFLFDPLSPWRLQNLEVFCNGVTYRTLEVKLDRFGAGEATLHRLPAGEYEVKGIKGRDASCAFTVASYQLSPLVASLVEMKKEGEELHFTVRLESFGTPVEGDISMEITERGRSIQHLFSKARNGLVQGSFEMKGDGPYALQIQMMLDASRTATLPLTGTRREERKETIISKLDHLWKGSLLPREGSREVRGIYLFQEGSHPDSPFLLERVDTQCARLVAKKPIQELRVEVIDTAVPAPGATGEASSSPGMMAARRILRASNEALDDKSIEGLAMDFYPAAQYMTACSLAGEGDRLGAVIALRDAIEKGFQDKDFLRNDESLASLHEYPPFEKTLQPFAREIAFRNLQEGRAVEIEVPSPLGVIVLGCFIDDMPWEGWAATIAPSGLEPSVEVAERSRPGEEVEISLDTGVIESEAYLVVKDARLLTGDTPSSRVAGKILRFAGNLDRYLRTGFARRYVYRGYRCNSAAQHLEDRNREVAESLVESGLITPKQKRIALEESRRITTSVEGILVEKGFCTEEEMTRWQGAQMRVDFVELSSLEIDPELARAIPEHLAQRHKVIPIGQQGNLIYLAMADPLDVIAIDDIRLITGFDIEPVIAEESAIVRAINQCFGVTTLSELEETVRDIAASDFGPVAYQEEDGEEIILDRLKEVCDEASVVRRDHDGAVLLSGALRSPVSPLPVPPPALHKAPPEVVFAGRVTTGSGKARISIKTGTRPCEYLVEAFALAHMDWASATARFRTEKSPHLHLQMPPFAHPEDSVQGELNILAGSGPMRLELKRNGIPVKLLSKGRKLSPDAAVDKEKGPFRFSVEPGEYHATLCEVGSGDSDTVSGIVEYPGRITGVARTVQVLSEGEHISRSDDPSTLELRVAHSVEKPMQSLIYTTLEYTHLCCEQTAAKILSAASMWLCSGNGNGPDRDHAESMIIAGIKRVKSMFIKDMGFIMYPGNGDIDTFYGQIAATYLQHLSLLRDTGRPLSDALEEAVEEGLFMASNGLKAYGMQWPPEGRDSDYDNYLSIRFGNNGNFPRILEKARTGLNADGRGSVANRTSAAYRAATLLRGGNESDVPHAIALANLVLKDINHQGRLYSTIDSVAAIALLGELLRKNMFLGATVRMDDSTIDSHTAGGRSFEHIEVLQGYILVELTRQICEDWDSLTGDVEVNAALLRKDGPAGNLKEGDAVDLQVSLPAGYRTGDIVWVSLPSALSRLAGGGQLKQFSVDFEGKPSINIPLAVTSGTGGGTQRVRLLLRNMYEEERIGKTGDITVQV